MTGFIVAFISMIKGPNFILALSNVCARTYALLKRFEWVN